VDWIAGMPWQQASISHRFSDPIQFLLPAAICSINIVFTF